MKIRALLSLGWYFLLGNFSYDTSETLTMWEEKVSFLVYYLWKKNKFSDILFEKIAYNWPNEAPIPRVSIHTVLYHLNLILQVYSNIFLKCPVILPI